MTITLFWILLLLTIAHFIGDYCYVIKWLHNKIQNAKINCNDYGYFFVHGALNGLIYAGVAAIFAWHLPWIIITVFLLEFVSHTGIDWMKSNINRKLKLQPTKWLFWFFLGLDQFFHSIFLLLVAFAIYAFI